MKYEFTLTVESPTFQADVNVVWLISDDYARELLKGVTVTRLRIANIDEVAVPARAGAALC